MRSLRSQLILVLSCAVGSANHYISSWFVLKLRKRGLSLRAIAEETSLGLKYPY